MRKGTIKAAVLAAVFIGAVLIFGRFMNDTNEDLTTEMKEATLPVITMYQGDQELNELHGYVTEMDAAYMRDTITPVGEDRKLPIVIQTNQTAVDTISYEIRSLDATRLIANADVTSYEERSGKITADLQIQNLLEEGEEYLMIIRLGSGERSICYYTRIAEPVDCYVSECVAFVKDFNDKTFNDETSGTLATYMERTTGDNTTLQFVSLNSSLKQVSWADFKGERLTEPVPSIKEITPTYNVIVLDYVVSSVNESGQIEYYNIEEKSQLMKKWYDEEYEFEIEVTGFLRGDHTERYCRNGEEVGDKYTCTYGCPVNADGQGICSKVMIMLFPIMEAVRSGGDLENIGGSGKYCKEIVCPDGCVMFRLTAQKLGNENFFKGKFFD